MGADGRREEAVSIDYDRIFWQTALEMVERKLEARGIESITEDQLDHMIRGLDVQREICRGELRQQYGLSSVPKMRMRW